MFLFILVLSFTYMQVIQGASIYNSNITNDIKQDHHKDKVISRLIEELHTLKERVDKLEKEARDGQDEEEGPTIAKIDIKHNSMPGQCK